MKRYIYSVLVFVFCVNNIAAQKYYYYNKGKKINLTLDKAMSRRNGELYFKSGNKTKSIAISNVFYIKLKEPKDVDLLKKVANEKNVNIVHKNKFMPLWYKLEVKKGNKKSSLEILNEFYETGSFQEVDPAFQFNFNIDNNNSHNLGILNSNTSLNSNCSNDPNFGDLWGLKNNTNPNIDINICDAWEITSGEGIKVAVVDHGVNKTHNDLNDNISQLSFNTVSGNSPSVFINQNNHGTHVAGTIAAERNNNLQVVGVAPESKIISVSNTLYTYPEVSEHLANGINWAVQNGADVINNSWGEGVGNYLVSALLEDSIENALNNGRNGLGTIVVFASGNDFNNFIGYPANSNPGILTVGAINKHGTKANFSNFGTLLDVVAPGVDVLSTIPAQETVFWEGTSMAAPHVAGIAALILSVNPDLTAQQVNMIIEKTSQKTGNYTYEGTNNRPNGTWNNKVGYGLVDAHKAVLMAQDFGCENHLVITNPVVSGETDYQQALDLIEASNSISSGGNAIYKAGNTVVLKPGFHAKLESDFSAFIEACDNPTEINSTNTTVNISVDTDTTAYGSNETLTQSSETSLSQGSDTLTIYPNPSNGLFNIKTEAIIVSYSIVDAIGNKIKSEKINTNLDYIDISEYRKGVYYLILHTKNKKILNRKLLKN